MTVRPETAKKLARRIKGAEVHASGPKLVDRYGSTWTVVKGTRFVEDENSERLDWVWVEERVGPLVPKGAARPNIRLHRSDLVWDLLRTGEAVNTDYKNDTRTSIGYFNAEGNEEEGVQIFIKESPPREPGDDDPTYVVALHEADQHFTDSLETDSPEEAVAQYREWRARWPAGELIDDDDKEPVYVVPFTVDTMTFHWCGHNAVDAEGGGSECISDFLAAKTCAKDRGINLVDERRDVLLSIVDVWSQGNLSDYAMTGFLGPALHDAGYRDIDTEPVGAELGWMTAKYIDPDHPMGIPSIDFDIERYGQDDPERGLMADRLIEQILNASPAQINEYVKVLDDLWAIAPAEVIQSLKIGLPIAVKERVTGRR